VNVSAAVARAAAKTELTGISRKYIEESASMQDGLSADAYFGPYLENLVEIIRSKGIQICVDNLDQLLARNDVRSDIAAELRYEDHRQGSQRKGGVGSCAS
jgi:hypothetical protein